MGDVLSGVFGGGSRTSQTTEPDAISKQLNALRLEQLQSLFGVAPYGSFALPDTSGAYTPSQDVSNLFKTANEPTDRSNLLSLQDYINLGLDSGSNYISQIAKPQILSTLAMQGLEGSGAVPEALAKATAQYSLPFIQSLPGASSQLSLIPGQQGLLSAQRASTLFPLADYGRSLQEQDLLRRQGVVTTGLTGLPFTPGQSSEGRKSSQPLFSFFGQG